MSIWQRPSAVSLLAAHLRGELERGLWSGKMPGVIRLAKELGAARKTVEGALRALEREGLLLPQGHGRGRRICVKGTRLRTQGLRVGILAGDAEVRGAGYMIDLQHELIEAGHAVFYAPRFLFDLKMEVRRVAAMVKQNPADAWLVVAGSREVLEWFMASEKPVFALFGRRRELPIASAGPDKVPAMNAATRELVRLGHRRVVLLTRRVRRLPAPGLVEQAFLDDLAVHDIAPGGYNLPDWEESIDGFHNRLESLFQVTAPTALIVDEVPFFLAVQQFLAAQGLRVPQDVSLVCTDSSPDFAWCRPAVAHIRWNSRPLVRRIVNWAANVSRGKEDKRQTFTPAEFVEGGTIGPVKDE